jgi:hypothetical protein
MGMKKFVVTTVGIRVRGKALPITSLIEDIDSTSKSVNFKVDSGLYRRFEYVVGRGNVSGVLRKFMSAVVKKYERLGNDFSWGVKNERQEQKQEKG